MYTNYVEYEDGEIRFSKPFEKKGVLDSSIYSVAQDQNTNELYLAKEEIQTESLVPLANSPVSKMLQKMDFFLEPSTREKYQKHGLLYKRGILLYGPPGTGKSSAVNQLISMVTKEKNMIVLLDPWPGWVNEACNNIRQIEKDRTILVVWEEFEDRVRHNESELLDLLDGVDQVENILYIATTNYLDKIPDRICRRPSRFADIIEIGYPDAHIRHQFLTKKLGDGYNINQWVEQTEGLSIDHLKDMIINVVVFGNTFEQALDAARKLMPDSQE